MKKLSLIAAAALAFAGSAFGAASTDSFDVAVTFTANCRVDTAATDVSFTYTGITDTAKTASRSTVFECSRGLTPTFSFDGTNGTAATSNGAQGVGTGLSAEGVIAGLRYTITSSGATKTTTGTAASAGNGGTGGSNGTSDKYTVGFTVDMDGGQAGDPSDTTTTQTRVLTITY